jgi:hypothetical protein
MGGTAGAAGPDLTARTAADGRLEVGKFSCANSLDDVDTLQLTTNKIRINDFKISEAHSIWANNALVLNLSASGSNRSEKPIHLSVEAVGYDSGTTLV